MTTERRAGNGEGPDLGGWVLETENRWKNVPEFRVDPERLGHLGIICDGNRRAAERRGLGPWNGHVVGVEVIKGISRVCRNWGIRTLTFWTWSTENWEREAPQVSLIMAVATQQLTDESLIRELLDNGVRFTHLGRKDRIPEDLKRAIDELEKRTAELGRYRLNLALDYGGEDELERAVRRIVNEVESGKVTKEGLDVPGFLSRYVDTAGQERPDFVIRTGIEEGELPHTSGFMPLQASYAGWAFLPDLFPDLTPDRLLGSIKDFLGYQRRLGR